MKKIIFILLLFPVVLSAQSGKDSLVGKAFGRLQCFGCAWDTAAQKRYVWAPGSDGKSFVKARPLVGLSHTLAADSNSARHMTLGQSTAGGQAQLNVIDNGNGSPIETHSTFAQALDMYTHSAIPARSPYVNFWRSRGTQAAPTAISSGDAIGGINFGGYTGSGYVAGAYVLSTATENFSSGHYGSDLTFYTKPNASATGYQRLYIGSGGTVSILGSAGTSTVADSLLQIFGSMHVNGYLRADLMKLSNTQKYFVTYDVNTGQFYARDTASFAGGGGGGFTNPMTTTGDIIYSSSGSTPARLGIGTSKQHLVVVSGLPAWRDTASVSSYTFTNGLTNSSGTVSLGGTLPASTTNLNGSGAGTQLSIGGSGNVDQVSLRGTAKGIILQGFISHGTADHIISAGSQTIATSYTTFSPSSTIASFTLTLPATASIADGTLVTITAGGGGVNSGTVVTSLTISPNTSQTLIQSSTPTTMVSGDCIIYRFDSTNNVWNRIK